MTYDELKKIHLIGEETIPRLDDLTNIISKTRAINIEIKSDSLFRGYDAIGPVVSFIKKTICIKSVLFHVLIPWF